MLLEDYFKITKQITINVQKEELKVIHVNINGVAAKRYKVQEFLRTENPDILALTKTHLKGQDEFNTRGYD